jgi:hypothetical protein
VSDAQHNHVVWGGAESRVCVLPWLGSTFDTREFCPASMFANFHPFPSHQSDSQLKPLKTMAFINKIRVYLGPKKMDLSGVFSFLCRNTISGSTPPFMMNIAQSMYLIHIESMQRNE